MIPTSGALRLVVLLLALQACAREASSSNTAKDLRRADVVAGIADFRKILGPQGIEVLETVPIGGIPQWLSIRGTDRANPILLFLHGGPGHPNMPLAHTQRGWEDYFTVVHWDQRGAGKTNATNDPAKVGPTMTLDRMYQDTEEVAAHLRTRFNKQKIFVVGHSWGSILGTMLAQRRPDWLHAYVGIGQVVAFTDNERVGYEWTLERARADRNAAAIAELTKIAPYPDANGRVSIEKLAAQRKWLQHYGGAVYRRTGYESENPMLDLSPDYSPSDLVAGGEGSGASLLRLLGDLERVDLRTITSLGCPTFLFLGRHDYNTPSTLAAAWFEQLAAPAKQIVWFEHSAHMAYTEEPGKMLVQLVAHLRPIAERAEDVAPERER